jgi:hypothetical protein
MSIFGAPNLIFNSSIDFIAVTYKGQLPLDLVPRQTAAQGEVSGVWSYWLVLADEIDGSNPSGVLVDFNITLCCTAFDTARLDVKFYGDSIHTEPLPQFQPSLESYTFNDIIIQLGKH